MGRSLSLAFLGFAALIPSLFVLVAGQNPWRVLTTLLLYAFGPQGWSEVLVHAVPLTLIGLGVAFALRYAWLYIGVYERNHTEIRCRIGVEAP